MDAAQSIFVSALPSQGEEPRSTFNKYELHGAYHYDWTIGVRSWNRYDLRMAARYLTGVKMLRLQPGELVLDAGSGEGVASILCCRAGARVVAVELDPEANRLGKQIAGREGFDDGRLTFRRDNLYGLPLATESVDKAISLEVIEHMTDLRAYLGELYRVLKPGGRLVISTPLRREDGVLQDRYHVQEFDHEQLRSTLAGWFREVTVYSCWTGDLNRRYESNRPFLLAAKVRRAATRWAAYRGRNPFVGPVEPDSSSALIMASALK